MYIPNSGVRGVLEMILERDDITIVDLHTHILSDDVHEKSPEYQFRRVIAMNGIDFIFETEHNRYPLLYGSEKPINGHVLPGVEISTMYGHINLLAKDGSLIKMCLDHFSRDLHKKYMRNPQLNPETFLNFIRDRHNKMDDSAVLVFPHSFQSGGIFYNDKNRKYPKLWLPSVYKQRKYFLEWTNSKRSPDSKTGSSVIKMVQEPEHNLLLVAGSDAHISTDVGMAGVVILGRVKHEEITQNLFQENYIVYHIHIFDGLRGRVMINTPRANRKRDYNLTIDYTTEGSKLIIKEKI